VALAGGRVKPFDASVAVRTAPDRLPGHPVGADGWGGGWNRSIGRGFDAGQI